MSSKVKSAKGEIVDFQLLKIKQSLGNTPLTIEVEAREKFIENKMKRRLTREKNKLLNKVENAQNDEIKNNEIKSNEILNNNENQKRKIKKKD